MITKSMKSHQNSSKFHFFIIQVFNKYKVNAVLGHNVPAGGSFAPPIIVHNPSKTEPLHIQEVFTTESFLHLSFPEWGSEGAVQAGTFFDKNIFSC